MPPAARVSDKVLQTGPHCHAPIHPPLPNPTPAPHPPVPLAIIPPGGKSVLIGGLPAARMNDMTQPCMLPTCVPGGPGMIQKGSATVMIAGQPAARLGDPTSHDVCKAATIPGPAGVIMPPCCPNVIIGG